VKKKKINSTLDSLHFPLFFFFPPSLSLPSLFLQRSERMVFLAAKVRLFLWSERGLASEHSSSSSCSIVGLAKKVERQATAPAAAKGILIASRALSLCSRPSTSPSVARGACILSFCYSGCENRARNAQFQTRERHRSRRKMSTTTATTTKTGKTTHLRSSLSPFQPNSTPSPGLPDLVALGVRDRRRVAPALAGGGGKSRRLRRGMRAMKSSKRENARIFFFLSSRRRKEKLDLNNKQQTHPPQHQPSLSQKTGKTSSAPPSPPSPPLSSSRPNRAEASSRPRRRPRRGLKSQPPVRSWCARPASSTSTRRCLRRSSTKSRRWLASLTGSSPT